MTKKFRTAAAFLALLTAGAALPALPAAAAAQSDAADAASDPEWLPKDFADAVLFTQQHGRTFVADGYVCTASVRSKYDDFAYTETVSDEARRIGEWDFAFPLPESVENLWGVRYGSEGFEELDEILMRLGTTVDEISDTAYSIHIGLYSASAAGEFSITQTETWGSDETAQTFTFAVAADGPAVETDLYGFLPDCEAEYDALLGDKNTLSYDNGAIAVAEDHIVFLGTNCPGACSFFTGTSEGTASAEEIVSYAPLDLPYVRRQIGGNQHVVDVWKPTSAGTLEMTWTKPALSQEPVTVQETFTVDPALHVTIGGGKGTPGDVDGDEDVTVRDIVLMQKFLMGESVVMQNADLNGDGRVNAIDFTLLKQAVAAKPVLIPTGE